MSTAVDSTQYTVSARDESHHPDAPASDKKRSIQHPKVLSQVSIADREGYMRMWNKVSRLWADFEGIAYEEVRDAILAQWIKSEPVNKKFLEKAVDLLVEFQNRPMKSMKDCLEWSDYLEKAEIDSKTYHSWVQEQYKQLACKKREGFENITLERFSKCLLTADWKDANDDSAIVNAYLLNAELCLKPEIYLGPFENFHLAVRVNGRCLRPRKADLSTAESYGVTAINPNILLAMRYVPRASWNLESFLFIPIGESIGPRPLTTIRYMLINWARECVPYGSFAPNLRHYKFPGGALEGHRSCPGAEDLGGGCPGRFIRG